MKKVESACIIDDDSIFIYGTKRIMEEVDFCDEIIVYNDGQDAIDGLTELIEQGKKLPSVIFLDLNMPIMNGWEFLDDFIKIANANVDKVVIYIISSSIDPKDLDRIQNYSSVRNYILKPLSPKDLESVMSVVG